MKNYALFLSLCMSSIFGAESHSFTINKEPLTPGQTTYPFGHPYNKLILRMPDVMQDAMPAIVLQMTPHDLDIECVTSKGVHECNPTNNNYSKYKALNACSAARRLHLETKNLPLPFPTDPINVISTSADSLDCSTKHNPIELKNIVLKAQRYVKTGSSSRVTFENCFIESNQLLVKSYNPRSIIASLVFKIRKDAGKDNSKGSPSINGIIDFENNTISGFTVENTTDITVTLRDNVFKE